MSDRLKRFAERMMDERDDAVKQVESLTDELARLRSEPKGDLTEEVIDHNGNRRKVKYFREDPFTGAVTDVSSSPQAVKLLALEHAASELRAACGRIVNNPTSDRATVQSALLIATQKYDKEKP